MKTYEQMSTTEADAAQVTLAEVVGDGGLALYLSRLALADDGTVGLAIKRPRLYDPDRSEVAPSGKPWLSGGESPPSEREWLATEHAWYAIPEALELLSGPRNPELEVERRARQHQNALAVARRREESLSQAHDERLAVDMALREQRRELRADVWEKELPGWGKVAFRLEAACRKSGLVDLAEEIRLIAVDSLKVTSASVAGHRLEVGENPKAMYLDGPAMPMEQWLP